MADGNDARFDSFRHPDRIHEVTDLGFHFGEVACFETKALRVLGIHPNRILVRDLIQPFCICRARVNKRGQAKVGQQNHLAFRAVNRIRVNVTLHCPRDDALFFSPAPIGECIAEEFKFLGGRVETRLGLSIHHQANDSARRVSGTIMLIAGQTSFRRSMKRLVEGRIILLLHFEHAILAHVCQRSQSFFCGGFGQARHRVLEDPLIVFIHRDDLARAIRRLEPLTNTERAIGVHLRGELNPKFVFFPHFARVGLIGEIHLHSCAFHRNAAHGLTESDPLPRVRFLTHQVVTFRSVTRRQNIIREPCGFIPRGRECNITFDLRLFALEHLEPHETIGVNPHRVVDAREINIDVAAPFLEHVRQKNGHLIMCERILDGVMQFVPRFGRGRTLERLGHELIPARH